MRMPGVPLIVMSGIIHRAVNSPRRVPAVSAGPLSRFRHICNQEAQGGGISTWPDFSTINSNSDRPGWSCGSMPLRQSYSTTNN